MIFLKIVSKWTFKGVLFMAIVGAGFFLSMPHSLAHLLARTITRYIPYHVMEEELNRYVKRDFPDTHIHLKEGAITFGSWRHPLAIQLSDLKIRDEKRALTASADQAFVSIALQPLLEKNVVPQAIHIPQIRFIDHSMDMSEEKNSPSLLLTIGFKATFDKNGMDCHISFSNIQCGRIFNKLFPSAFFKALPLDEISLQGNLSFYHSQLSGTQRVTVKLHGGKGRLYFPGLYETSPQIDRLSLQASMNDQMITIQKLNLYHQESKVTLLGQLKTKQTWNELWEKGGQATFFAQTKVNVLPLASLPTLWPHAVAKKARAWVTKNIRVGLAENVKSQFGGSIDLAPEAIIRHFSLSLVNGKIDAKDVSLSYFGELPQITQAKGSCTFTKDRFSIQATGAAQKIQIKKGKIEITDLDKIDQFIDIDLDLEGPLESALNIIAQKPLEFPKKLGLDKAKVQGKAKTHLKLYFLLEEGTPIDQVQVKVDSHITDGSISTDLGAQGSAGISLEQGVFDLSVNPQILTMSGKGIISNTPITLQWTEQFDEKKLTKKSPFLRQMILKGAPSIKALKKIGANLEPYVDGSCQAIITYEKKTKNQTSCLVQADFKSSAMRIPILSWEKGKGQFSKGSILLSNLDGKNATVRDFSLTAPNMTIKGSGDLSEKGVRLTFSTCHIGQTNFRGTLFQNLKKAKRDLHIDFLDLSRLIEETNPPISPLPPSKEEKIKTTMTIRELVIGQKKSLYNITGFITTQGDSLQEARLHGQTYKTKKAFTLMVRPLGTSQQEVILQADDAADILESFGAGYDLEGGTLKIKGIKTTQRSDWSLAGKITLTDFKVHKAPALAKLLSAASLNGLINLFSGQGIQFNKGKGEFILTPQRLDLKKFHLDSFALGLNISGYVNRQTNYVEFQGELIPLYFANTMVAHIPILGALLSGGRKEGVFMTLFQISGPRKDPTLSINPVSAITPGIMRESFGSLK